MATDKDKLDLLVKVVNKQSTEDKIIRRGRATREMNYLKEQKKAKAAAALLASPEETTDWATKQQEAVQNRADRSSAIPFINDSYTEFIQLSSRSLVLIAAQSGTGKSTISANITARLIKDGKKVLVIVNEEAGVDVGIRVACLLGGWNIHKYMDNNGYQEATKQDIEDYLLSLNGLLEVRGLDYKGSSDIVTSTEGMRSILEEAVGKYSCIVIDYYQNVRMSLNNVQKDIYQCQDDFSSILDEMKFKVGCPIIIFAQCNAGDKPLSERIQGRKSIFNKLTDCYEFTQNKDDASLSMLKCNKARWLNVKGHFLLMNYSDGILSATGLHKSGVDEIMSKTEQYLGKTDEN